ncbi:MAG: DNA ligase D [Gemmatimonadetes bacterium]|nr:DNA ligase D [Gemmatimonadota bacterium]NIO32408.1 DNA ligase D [Gemmatimonadota bacterium]
MSLDRYKDKRDFARSPEPEGSERAAGSEAARRFVVQKHAARRTHFDLRLEIGGTLVSWAVPKGPSADPGAKRLAVHVEDHPLEYGEFEGVIPKGEYGAGGVIIWDRGRYEPVGETEDSEEALGQGVREGKLDFVLYGERMKGRWTLVRMKGREGEDNWLLIKKKDVHAEPGEPEGLVERYLDSVVSGRGLDDPALGAPDSDEEASRPPVDTRPMLAQSSASLPTGEAWCFELKLDGIRAVAWGRPAGAARIYSRRGTRLETAFPEVADAVELLARRASSEFVIDGEIVAAATEGGPSFEDLQPRFNLREAGEIARGARAQPAEMYVFDLLWLDGEDLRDQPLSGRKDRLRPLLKSAGHNLHYLPHDVASGVALRSRARQEGWEGVVAKRLKGRYYSGERTADWVKVKQLARQEFVVGGWTQPQGGRRGFGALVVGYYEVDGADRHLHCAGRVGSGFSDADLGRIKKELDALASHDTPFIEVPEDVKDARWVRPELVAEVKFQEWTRDGRLRQPVFLGLRSDRDPARVVREGTPAHSPASPKLERTPQIESLLQTLETLERAGEDGDVIVDGRRLKLTNLQKTFWPDIGATKGELLRYYLSMAPAILPVVSGRPLTLERYPNGITGALFYQQRTAGPVPEGVQTVTLDVDGEPAERVVGGDLYTLLYTVQLAAISQHVWPSRVGSLDEMDYTVLDLDPGEGVPFSAVCEAALATREQLQRLGLRGYPKTSGASGMHIVIPLEKGTSYETGRLLAELVAQLVAQAQPDLTTVQRVVAKRGPRVYLDFLQNRRGATVASAYSVRPRPGGTVSAPLSWAELETGIEPGHFDLRSMRERVDAVGDLWVACRTDANDVREVLELL